MFSFADPTGKRTASGSLRNCLYMLPLGLFAHNWGLTSELLSLEASLLTLGLTIGVLSFVLEPSSKTARRNLLVCNHALQLPMLPWLHSLSYRCPYMSHENLLWFFLQQWACVTVGAMCSCIFGLLYTIFLPSRGVLGACVVIDFFFMD